MQKKTRRQNDIKLKWCSKLSKPTFLWLQSWRVRAGRCFLMLFGTFLFFPSPDFWLVQAAQASQLVAAGPIVWTFGFPVLGFHKWGYPKLMVYNGKSYQNGWFRGTPLSGNLHIYVYLEMGYSYGYIKWDIVRSISPTTWYMMIYSCVWKWGIQGILRHTSNLWQFCMGRVMMTRDFASGVFLIFWKTIPRAAGMFLVKPWRWIGSTDVFYPKIGWSELVWLELLYIRY